MARSDPAALAISVATLGTQYTVYFSRALLEFRCAGNQAGDTYTTVARVLS